MSTKEKEESNEEPCQTTPKIDQDEETYKISECVDEHGNFIERPPAVHRRLMGRIDWHVLPWISILHWIGTLARGDIGKARLFGLEEDLHMVGTDFNIALLMFSVTHIIFEIPSNMLLKKVKPSIWLPGILSFSDCLIVALALGGGLSTMVSGWSQNLGDLITCRLFMGLFQAGLFPGCIYLISMWYKRDESTPHEE